MDVIVPCPCPGTPHPDGDTVTLRDKPTLHMGTTAFGWANMQATEKKPTSGDIAELYLRDGIVAWTFLEEDGTPKPVTEETIDWLLDDFTLAYPVADKAADVYTDIIFRPLVDLMPKASKRTRASRRSSSSGPTESSTSVTSISTE